MAKGKGFKDLVIAHAHDLPRKHINKIKGWVEHAGGRHVDEYCDEVTHFIVSRNAWTGSDSKYEHIIQKARREKSFYLMTFAWLKHSLEFNKGHPIPETTGNYAWEPKHAGKVAKKLQADKKEAQQKARKEKARQKRLLERGLDPDDVDSDSDAQGQKSGDGGKPAKKARITQSSIGYGIKFDKSVLEFERDMALDGYKPHVNENGFVHMVTLLRDDINRGLVEQYQLKLYESFDRPSPRVGDMPCTPESTYAEILSSSARPATFHPTPDTSPQPSSAWQSETSFPAAVSSIKRPHCSKERHYAVYVQYTRKAPSPRGKGSATEMLAPHGSMWDVAYDIFCKFFAKKTGHRWDEAIDMADASNVRRDSDVPLDSQFHIQQKDDATATDIRGRANAGVGPFMVERGLFVYVPLTTEQLAEFEKKYARAYGEAWLPVSKVEKQSAVPTEIEEDVTMEVQTRPDDDEMKLVYDEGQVEADIDVEGEMHEV